MWQKRRMTNESFKSGDEEERRRKTGDSYLKVTPFLFDENSRDEETTFEVFSDTIQRIRERHINKAFP